MKVQPKFDYNNFARIDELLSAIHYRGISITGVPGNFLKDTFITTPYDLTLRKQIVSFLGRIRLRYFQNFANVTNIKMTLPTSTPYLFSFTDYSARLMDFALPVIAKLGNENCIVTTPVAETGERKISYNYHSFPCINKQTYRDWQKEYSKIAPAVKKTIQQIRKEKNISYTAAIDLETNIMYQTLLHENALDFLSKAKPKALVCDSDRQPTNCALVMAANKTGIPTFTFIHGSIDPPDNYIPILTKYIFCWGNDHVQVLRKVNTSLKKMMVTGNTKISRSLEADVAGVRKKLNIPSDNKKTIVLFTNNIDPILQIGLAKSFIDFCKGNEGVRGILKLHPLESPNDYAGLSFPEDVRLYPASFLTLDEALVVADGVMSHNSLVAVDTLIKHKPLAILHTVDLPLGIAERLHLEANVPMVSNQDSFNRFVESLSENTYSFEQKEKFVHNYCSAFGTEAVDNTIHALLSKT
jgi:hypothetical protein